METLERDTKIRLVPAIPFATMHVAAVAGVLLVDVTWAGLILCLAMYYLRMWGIAVGFHRYFAHKAFKTGRTFQFLLALVGTMAAQKGPLWWSGRHREHHRYADQPGDPHSPSRDGIFWSHVGWVLSGVYNATPDTEFQKYPELRWLNRNYLIPPAILALMLLATAGYAGLFWGFFVSTVLLWHGTFTVNSVMHLVGSRRYGTPDTSRNVWWLCWLVLGENWHNNHHRYQVSARQGFFWWEIDLAYYSLRLIQDLRLIWDLRTPPAHLLQDIHGRSLGSSRAA